jgi:hypothetical protein
MICPLPRVICQRSGLDWGGFWVCATAGMDRTGRGAAKAAATIHDESTNPNRMAPVRPGLSLR